MRKVTKETIDRTGAIVLLAGLFLLAGCSPLTGKYSGREGVFKAGDDRKEVKAATEMTKDDRAATERTKDDRAATEKTKEDQSAAESTEGNHGLLYVHVCGAVKKPGLYMFETGSRAGEAVEAAGGFNDKADTAAVNLASLLEDGQQIYVPDTTGSGSQRQAGIEAERRSVRTGGSGRSQAGTSCGQVREDVDRININTADAGTLTSLSGIGEARAVAIIEYRQKNGSFSSAEDIRNVPGIGDGIYRKIKDFIKI